MGSSSSKVQKKPDEDKKSKLKKLIKYYIYS